MKRRAMNHKRFVELKDAVFTMARHLRGEKVASKRVSEVCRATAR